MRMRACVTHACHHKTRRHTHTFEHTHTDARVHAHIRESMSACRKNVGTRWHEVDSEHECATPTHWTNEAERRQKVERGVKGKLEIKALSGLFFPSLHSRALCVS